jgi:dihydrodipicolinate synthase/N-acetylneuraminate lyase
MEKLRGVIPPMVTPFTREGAINEKGLEQLTDFLSQNVHGVFLCGSYGGGPLMNVEERKRVIELVSKRLDPSRAMTVHVGTTNVRDSVELAKFAEEKGAKLVAAVGPYYYKHTDENLLLFYKRLVDAVKIPVYVYNNPQLSGYNISINLMKKLSEAGVSGVKDSTFDIMYFADLIRKVGTDFDVVLGTEAMFLSAGALGATAFVPGLGNAFPEICVELFNAVMDKKYEEAREIQFKVNSLRDIMYQAGSTMVAVYTMLGIRGICEAYSREPFSPVSETVKEKIRKDLQDCGVL